VIRRSVCGDVMPISKPKQIPIGMSEKLLNRSIELREVSHLTGIKAY
jgi:hypothetical protein